MSVSAYPTLRFKLTMPQALKLQFLPAIPGSNASAAADRAEQAAQDAQNAANTAVAATANKVDKSGDVMTGFLTLNANPTTNLQAATKQYVDAHASGISDAPSDGNLYGRLNAAWTQAQPFDADLSSLASASGTNTIYYRSGLNTWSPVTVGATMTFLGGVLNTTSGGGNVIASGTPINGQWARWTSAATIEGVDAASTGFQPIDADLTAIAALTGTNVIYYRSAANTWSPVTIGANLTFTGGTLAATGGGGGAPVGAEYITSTADATLSAERVLTDSATITWDRTTAGQIKANTAAGGGNVSNSGTPTTGQLAQWVTATTIQGVNNVTLAQLPTIATDSLLGRDTAGTGAVENITLNATLSMTGALALQRAALTGDITAVAGSNTTAFRSGSARSVLGVTGNAAAVLADIQGAADQVLRVNGAGTALAFGMVAMGGIADNAVSYLKMQDVSAASRLLGRGSAAGAGDPQEITLGTGLTMTGTVLDAASGGGGTFQVGIQRFTSSGTYTPMAGISYAIVECIGGGGGGGTAGNGSATQTYQGGGGGGGGYSRKIVTAAQIGASQTVTIGVGGLSDAAGTATSFGTLCIANGGGAGGLVNSATNPFGGPGGAPGTGDVTVAGAVGGWGMYSAISQSIYSEAGNGAPGPFGGGSTTLIAIAGSVGTGYGAGGSGGSAHAASISRPGGEGAPGIVIITEYAGSPTGASGGNVVSSGVPLNGQIAQWTSSNTIQGVTADAINSRVLLTTLNPGGGAFAVCPLTAAGFDWFEIWVQMEFANAGAVLIAQISTDGGATYDAVAGHYYSVGTYVASNNSGGPSVNAGGTYMAFNNSGGNAATMLRIFRPSVNGIAKWVHYHSGTFSTFVYGNVGVTLNLATTLPHTHIRLATSDGSNWNASSLVKVYGIR